MRSIPVFLSLLTSLAVSPLAQGQGKTDSFNVESPVVNALAAVTNGDSDYLVVCNTPDSSLELWKVTASTATFVMAVPVGLEPVTVKVLPWQGDVRFYTANFLGDSITTGRLEFSAGTVDGVIERTVNLVLEADAQGNPVRFADEPTDLDFFIDGNNLFVLTTHFSSSSFGVYDGITLDPVLQTGGLFRQDLVLDASVGTGLKGERWGLKEPRVVKVRGGQVFFLATKGGDTRNSGGDLSWDHDLDLIIGDVNDATFATPLALGASVPVAYGGNLGIGSTNFNMRFASNGDLYVVGGEAQNFATQSKAEVLDEEVNGTGIMQHTLVRLTQGVPGTWTLNRAINWRDLNRNAGGAPLQSGDRPLALTTDLVLFEELVGEGMRVTKVFVIAQGSDRIGVLRRPAVDNGLVSWIRDTIDVRVGAEPPRGPRSAILHELVTGERLLFVANRFDNSVVAINANTELEVLDFALNHDPTPDHVRQGRPILYDASLSANGTSACASCHTDGRTDGLAWRLGGAHQDEVAPTTASIFAVLGSPNANAEHRYFLDMLDLEHFDPDDPSNPDDPEDKHEMMTQSLQGLMNFEIDLGTTDPDVMRDLFSNAPFHWRGDKRDFLDFNEAFTSLMGRPSFSPPGQPLQGIDPAQMALFEEFVFSIQYPPNPQQPQDRTYSGDTDTTGAEHGLRLFHEKALTESPAMEGLSCVNCHSLPEGSNNQVTITADVGSNAILGYATADSIQAIESAALRGLLQREGILQDDGYDSSEPDEVARVAHFGLTHLGTFRTVGAGTVPDNRPLSLNSFTDVFGPDFPGGSGQLGPDDLNDIKQYLHEFDWGVAPMVGRAVTVTASTIFGMGATLFAMEAQCEVANVGLAVQARIDGAYRGFVYAPPLGTSGQYVEVDTNPPATFTRIGLVNLMSNSTDPDARMTWIATPLGTDRRVALPNEDIDPVTGGNPGSIELLDMVPNTANAAVPTFVEMVDPDPVTPNPFLFPSNLVAFPLPVIGASPTNGNLLMNGPYFVRDAAHALQLRLFQAGFITVNDYGFEHTGEGTLRHEAPRRLRVAATNLRPGAVLNLYVPHPTPGNPQVPFDWKDGPNQPGETLKMTFPLYPTDQKSAGNPIWETAIELEPKTAYILMMGGMRAPGVQDVLQWSVKHSLGLENESMVAGIPDPSAVTKPAHDEWRLGLSPSPFDPDNWNWHFVEVVNEDGSSGDGGWQQLRME